MGKTTRRKFTPEFKAKVVLEALKESSTMGELAKIARNLSGDDFKMEERVDG